MCRKIIFTNHYPDGQKAQSEEVEFCRSSVQMCPHPKIVNRHREVVVDRHSPYQSSLNVRVNYPPSPPRSKTPSPSRKHTKYDDHFVEYTDMGTSKEKKRRSTRPVVVLPPTPDPATPRRTATTPTEYLVVEQPHEDRYLAVEEPHEDRYLVVEEHHHKRGRHSSRRNSLEVPMSVPVLEDLAARRKSRPPLVDDLGATTTRRRPSLSSSPTPTWPRSKRSSTTFDPRVIHQQWEEPARPSSSKRERRKTRIGLIDSETSSSTSTGASAGPYMTPAARSGRNRDRGNVHWVAQDFDEQIERQNAIIDARQPRSSRTTTELRGILKKEKLGGGGDETYEELRRSVRNMDIPSRSREREGGDRKSRERERGSQRERKSEREHYRDAEDQTYWERLKGRFDDDPLTRRRRSKVVYAGEDGAYKYHQ